MGLFFVMVSTIRAKEEMIQQKYKVIHGVNYRADMKQFTHTSRHYAKLDIMSILRRCKK